jgi:hypothetical protein
VHLEIGQPVKVADSEQVYMELGNACLDLRSIESFDADTPNPRNRGLRLFSDIVFYELYLP